jgi:prepilin-type N-terminal cleavage/methylation domain-containing protein
MKRDAFTLVEILVVIAVIALLLMILMPSYQRAAAMTRATLCRNNLAKLSTAFATHAYTTEGGASAKTLNGIFNLPNADTWPAAPYDVCPVPTLFICPEKEEKSIYTTPKNPMEGLRYQNSGYNRTDRGWDIPFTEVGLGKMYFGTRRGRDSRGDYIEVGLDDNSAVTADYIDNDGHDGVLRVYLEPGGKVVIKLIKYSCGENNCVLYFGKPLFPDDVTNPADPFYGWLGPNTSKNNMERELSRGMQCSYGINERSGDLHYGDGRVLLVDYDKTIVNLSNAECPKLLSTAAQRHLGKLNMLLTDGAVRPTGPTQLDPLLGDQKLWEP